VILKKSVTKTSVRDGEDGKSAVILKKSVTKTGVEDGENGKLAVILKKSVTKTERGRWRFIRIGR
jgi:hypothetical protein